MNAVTPLEPLPLRPMRDADIRGVVAVEHRGYTHPWSEGIFRDCLRAGYSAWVVEDGERIVGHGLMSVAAGECHILNICVAPDYQGRGLGRQLMDHLLDLAVNYGASLALLEVRPSNAAARALYDRLGFDEIGTRPNYYPAHDGKEDALVLAKQL